MKMYRLLTGIFALLLITLAGCGNQSPDFSPRLKSITIQPSPIPSVGVGEVVHLTAVGHCTTAPGTFPAGTPEASTYQDCKVSNVNWTVTSDDPTKTIGTITVTGPDTADFTAGPDQGTGHITASGDGQTVDAPVTVGPPTLIGLVISPPSATISKGNTQDYTVQGHYSDGVNRNLPSGTVVTWSSSDQNVATVSPATGDATTATGVNAGTTTITACSPDCTSAGHVSGTSALTVDNKVLVGLADNQKLRPPAATVPRHMSQDYQMWGLYSSDGGATTHAEPIPNSQIDWTVDNTVASLTTSPTKASSVTATGDNLGMATITGTLKAGVAPSITNRASTGTLTVIEDFCTTPLSASSTPAATTATPAPSGLCLLCGVVAPNNVIDADPTNYAAINSTVGLGLLNSNVELIVNSNRTTPFTAGQEVGFVIGRPAGALLSAEVLSQLTVSTYQGGVLQESVPFSAAATLPPLLRATLLGALGGINTFVLHFQTTKTYDAISLTFGTGVASLLTSTQVFSACGSIDTAKLPTP